MKARGVRRYGEIDLRLEEFELPEIKDGEILAKICSRRGMEETGEYRNHHLRRPKQNDLHRDL